MPEIRDIIQSGDQIILRRTYRYGPVYKIDHKVKYIGEKGRALLLQKESIGGGLPGTNFFMPRAFLDFKETNLASRPVVIQIPQWYKIPKS